jgi:hypothetical protein
MKIYMAATAPGNEFKGGRVGKIRLKRRLLSYHLISQKTLFCDLVFNNIKDRLK